MKSIEAYYNAFVAHNSDSPCYISDLETHDLIHMTNAAMRNYGMSEPEEYQGKKCHKVIMGLDEPCAFCPKYILLEKQEHTWEHYNERVGRWYNKRSTVIEVDGRKCHLMIAHDITEHKEEMAFLSGRLSMEDVVFHCVRTLSFERDMDTAMNLFLTAVGGYYHANRAYIFEFDREDDLLDNTFEWCKEGVSAEIGNLQRIPMEVVTDWIKKFKEEGAFCITSLDGELDHDSADYRILQAQGINSLMAVPLIQNGVIVGFMGVDDAAQHPNELTLLRTVSEFVQVELDRRRLMDYISFTDALTGLKNRDQFEHLRKEYERRTPDSLGVILMDINGMKVINNTHGTSYGDYIIRKIAQITRRICSGDVFRISGDEFAVLVEDMERDEFRREVAELREAFQSEEDCSVAMGCVWKAQEENIPSLLKQAEELRGAEKQAYYHNLLQDGCSVAYSSLSGELAKELDTGCFTVYYQPQVDIQTKRVIGAEALVRKMDPETGAVIPPNKFIPLFEAEGIIGQLDLFVLHRVCQSMRGWLDRGYQLQLAVNFSRATLMEPGIVDKISKVCLENRVPPTAITIEVTESISTMDGERLKQLLQEINERGFSISLDDFGSQFSNLSILSEMDFDEVKFDRSLVSALEESRKSRVILKNCIDLCHDLEETHTLAEGIETEGQLELLNKFHCDYGQGYYFSRPLPKEAFEAILEQGSCQ